MIEIAPDRCTKNTLDQILISTTVVVLLVAFATTSILYSNFLLYSVPSKHLLSSCHFVKVQFDLEDVLQHPLADSFLQRCGRVVNIVEFKHNRNAVGKSVSDCLISVYLLMLIMLI